MRKMTHLIALALGLTLSLTPFVLFPVCAPMPGNSPMMCWYSGVLIQGLGALVGIVSVIGLWRRASTFAHVTSAVAALMCWLIPHRTFPFEGWQFGLCGDAAHACRATTMPAVGLLVLAIVIVSTWGLIMDIVRGGPWRGPRR